MKPAKILIVDDDALNRLILTTNLEENGYEVAAVENGRLALDTLQERPFDLILLDLVMPGLDGFAVLEQLKQSHTLRLIPVLVISASDQMDDIIKCIEMGAIDYLTKPIDPVLLHARIRASLTTKQMIDLKQTYTQMLEEQNADLSAFAHTVAHDLKNPISGIIGYTDLLKDMYGDNLDAQGQRLLNRLQRMADRMASIVESLLTLAQVRGEHPDPTPINMASIIRNMESRLQYQIDQTEATLHLPDSWPMAWGYTPWIEEVWVNYVSNALKYGGSPPVVEFGATIQGQEVQFWVQDNGDGIPAAEQNTLFTEFTRLTKVGEGSGLGLSIVARILKKLGGSYGVVSEAGQGSRFWFTLPQTKPDSTSL